MPKVHRMLNRIAHSGSFWVFVSVASTMVLVNLNRDPNPGTSRGLWSSAALAEDTPPTQPAPKERALLREGSTIVEAKGKFRVVKDRLIFREDGSTRTFVCLENQMLQRVASYLSDEDRRLVWVVTGRITEYESSNYLLIEKATRGR
ncbi:MAG: hypothetical protein FJ308_05435 [Planctomycetes bacterium]|nr:hypothetical protein [Planctomycetota bacterium]